VTNYGFVPGGTPFELAAADYVRFHSDTKIISLNSTTHMPLATMQEFIAEVGTKQQTTLPVDDFFVVSHGIHVGTMALQLDDKLTGESFEEVEKAAASGTIAIPAAVRDPRLHHEDGTPIPCVVHIVGCFVGRFDPYMRRLRKAMGDEGAFGVEAPNKWDTFYAKPDGSAIFKGALRYMLYDFRVGNIDALATRDDLIAALKAKSYRRIDSSVVPDKVFENAVPARNFNDVGRIRPATNVTLKPKIEGRGTIPILGVYDHSPETVGPFLLAKGPENAVPRAARQTFVEGELEVRDEFKPNHPLPFYERFDFSSLSDFVKGFDWFRDAAPADDQGHFSWTATRHLYMCGVPVVDPANDKDLVYDYVSADGTVQRLTLSNDPNFFARVFTS
jgi:hypothetical protein